ASEKSQRSPAQVLVDAADVAVVIEGVRGRLQRHRDASAYVRRHRVPAIRIPAAGLPAELIDETREASGEREGSAVNIEPDLRHLWNREFKKYAKHQEQDWPPDHVERFRPLPIPEMRAWIMPDFTRTDLLALHFQKRHEQFSLLTFAVAPTAV